MFVRQIEVYRLLDHLVERFAVSFQVRLPLSEQSQVNNVHIQLMVIDVSICPFEGLTSSDHLIECFRQKLHLMLLKEIVFDHQLLFQVHYVLGFFCFAFRMLMVVISFEVELVSTHVSGRLFFLLFLLSEALLLPFLLIQIANVVSASLRSMLIPVPHADPTEVKFTICALHVITATILFYWAFAVWTALGMSQEPQIVGTLLNLFI